MRQKWNAILSTLLALCLLAASGCGPASSGSMSAAPDSQAPAASAPAGAPAPTDFLPSPAPAATAPTAPTEPPVSPSLPPAEKPSEPGEPAQTVPPEGTPGLPLESESPAPTAAAPVPTPESTSAPTLTPSPAPTAVPTTEPTAVPAPSLAPTAAPTSEPTEGPAAAPTEEPSTAPAETLPAAESTAQPADTKRGADEILSSLTLREKVGQLFFVKPESLDPQAEDPSQEPQPVSSLTQTAADTLRDYPAGGIILFGQNITGPDGLAQFLSSLQEASSLPLFLGVDEEGGLVARLANHSAFSLPKYENAAAVGASGNPEDARSMGSTIGSYLRKNGFNLDFAPVADVNTNPDNPVIGTRAFSSNPAVAASMANAMADGLQQEGIIPVFKHFPGHGDTAEDSHSGIAVSWKTKEEMEQCEWLPYASLTSLDCVMVGHIAVPEITGDLTPASLSHAVVSEILRQDLGFQGVVITDSLVMGAITAQYSSGEAAVLALEAGCDLLLCPQDYCSAFDAVLDAVNSGRIPLERLEESVLRILQLKEAYGILS